MPFQSPYPNYSGYGYDSADDGFMFQRPVTGGGGGADRHPWKVSLSPNPTAPETGDPIATLTRGSLVDSLLGVVGIDIDNLDTVLEDGIIISEEGALVLKHTYADGPEPASTTIEFIADSFTGDWKPYVEDDQDPPEIIASYYPLATFVEDPELAPLFAVAQLARSNMALTQVCYNGKGLTTFTPI